MINSRFSSIIRKGNTYGMGVAASIMDRASGLFLFIYIARNLSKEITGEFALIMTVSGALLLLSGLGFPTVLTSFIPKYLNTRLAQVLSTIKVAKIINVIMSIILLVVFFVFTDEISKYITLTDHGYGNLKIQALATATVFEILTQLNIGILIGFECIKQVFKLRLLKLVLIFFGAISCLYFFGYIGIYISWIAATLIVYMISELYSFEEVKDYKRALSVSNIGLERSIWSLALPVYFSALITQPAILSSRFILKDSSASFSGLASFSAAGKIQGVFNMIGVGLGSILVPKMSKRDEWSQSLHEFNLYGNWILSLIIVIPFLLFPILLTNIFGANFSEKEDLLVFQIVLFYGSINLFKQGVGRMLLVKDKMWLSFLSQSTWTVCIVVFSFLLKDHGAVGVAIGFLISYLINILLIFPYQCKQLDMDMRDIFSRTVSLLWIFLILDIIVGHYLDSHLLRMAILVFNWIIIYRLIKSKFI